jgi:hypothetical protein
MAEMNDCKVITVNIICVYMRISRVVVLERRRELRSEDYNLEPSRRRCEKREPTPNSCITDRNSISNAG